MPDTALRRTIRRCTAVLVLVIALGVDALTEYGFEFLLPVAGLAGAYLLFSSLLDAVLRFEDRAETGGSDDQPSDDAESAGGGDP